MTHTTNARSDISVARAPADAFQDTRNVDGDAGMAQHSTCAAAERSNAASIGVDQWSLLIDSFNNMSFVRVSRRISATKLKALVHSTPSSACAESLTSEDRLDDQLQVVSSCHHPQKDVLLRLQRHHGFAGTRCKLPAVRQQQWHEQLEHPSGLVQHQWDCLRHVSESVHALEQRLHAERDAQHVQEIGHQEDSGDLKPLLGAHEAAPLLERPWRYFPEPPPRYCATIMLGRERQSAPVDVLSEPSQQYCMEVWVRNATRYGVPCVACEPCNVQIESVEFTSHPLMREEELLAGKLLELFTQYKRRQASNALQFYGDRLLGLEDALLETRHLLLDCAQSGQHGCQLQAEAATQHNDHEGLTQRGNALYQQLLELEKDVQLHRGLLEDEEQAQYVDCVADLAVVYSRMEHVRSAQGFRLTPWELDVESRCRVVEHDGDHSHHLTRSDLDTWLLMAERVAVQGLDDPIIDEAKTQHYLPGNATQSDEQPFSGYAESILQQHNASELTLRRVECLAHAHQAARSAALAEVLAASGSSEAQAHANARLHRLGVWPQRAAEGLTEGEWVAQREQAVSLVQQAYESGARLDGAAARPMPSFAHLREEPQHITDDVTLRQHNTSRVSDSRQIVCALHVNNQLVAQSTPKTIYADSPGSFLARIVPVQERIQVQLYAWPASVTVKLYEATPRPLRLGFASRTLLAEVPVHVPGTAAAGPAPPAHGISWASPANRALPAFAAVLDADSEAVLHEGAHPDAVHTIMPAGKVYAQASWVAPPLQDPAAQAAASLRANPVYLSENVADAFVVNMPVVPPRPPHLTPVPRLETNGAPFSKWQGAARLDPLNPDHADMLELRCLNAASVAGQPDTLSTEAAPTRTAVSAARRKAELLPGSTGYRKQRKYQRATWRPDKCKMMDDHEEALDPGPQLSTAAAQAVTDDKLGALLRARAKQRKAHLDTLRRTLAELQQGKAQRHVSDFVREPQPRKVFLSIGALFSRFKAQRRLNPNAELRLTKQATSGPAVLHITIKKAAGLVSSAKLHAQDVSEQKASWRFVEVCVGNVTTHTEVVSCRADEEAIWYQQLLLPLSELQGAQSTNRDAAAPSLAAQPTHVDICVYDQIVRPHSHDVAGTGMPAADAPSGEPASVALPVRQCHSYTRQQLASARIALASIWNEQQQKQAAAAQSIPLLAPLQPPTALLGYQEAAAQPRAGVQAADAHVEIHASLSGHVALPDPPAVIPAAGDRFITTSESAALEVQEQRWLVKHNRFGSLGRQQAVYGFVCAMDGAGRCITRFVAPARLPPQLRHQIDLLGSANNRLMQKHVECVAIANFVSQVPVHPDPPGRVPVWLTNAQTLQCAGGARKEHAHLLAAYIMECQPAEVVADTAQRSSGTPSATLPSANVSQHSPSGQDMSGQVEAPALAAYIVVGVAVDGVHAHFVATGPAEGLMMSSLPASECLLWNPVSGSAQRLSSDCSELREVAIIYNDRNVWANLQRSGLPHQISWNISDTKSWAPLRSTDDVARELLPTVQDTLDYASLVQMAYGPADPQSLGEAAVQLARNVEESCKDFMTSERRRLERSAPRWKLALCEDLTSLLITGRIPSEGQPPGSSWDHKQPPDVANTFILTRAHRIADVVSNTPLEVVRGPSNSFDSVAQPSALVNSLDVAHLKRLQTKLRASNIVGYLLRIPYSDTVLTPSDVDQLTDVKRLLRATGLASLDAPGLHYAQAAVVEHHELPFVCCVWLYVVAYMD